jgi:NAD(P)-dependent dehydrogenase (short-subunit alcohol dehydrogenase family)
MTRAAAVEYAPDKVHINSIHPGYCDSPFLEAPRAAMGMEIDKGWVEKHPWGRLAWPEDVARMAVFLAGEGAGFVTGQRELFLLPSFDVVVLLFWGIVKIV